MVGGCVGFYFTKYILLVTQLVRIITGKMQIFIFFNTADKTYYYHD